MNDVLDAIVLAVHLFSAVVFIGGSFFIWLVVDPVSYRIAPDEPARTALVGQMARRFAGWTTPLLLVLIVTGLYNVTWYLPSGIALLTTFAGEVLAAKMGLVLVLVVLIYVHGLYFGRKISRLAREGNLEELRRVRRTSRIVSYTNLGLMLAVLALAVMLQWPY